jgi:hypothetical protein
MVSPSSAISEPVAEPPRLLYAAAVWGVVGFTAILGRALWQLTPLALEPIRAHSLTTLQVALYIVWVVFMA